ncbi:YdcF family protein [Oleiharenicola lentus]|uniref:YdcF family protein n=1 Tax=Oleiharenicola lentus TaxID=2508720 RepID=UPI003F661527
MLILNKLLPIFVLPTGIATLLLLFAIWKKKRWPIVAALALMYVCSAPRVGEKLIGWVENTYPAIAVDAVEKADAIVVLGGLYGPAMPDGYVANWSESVERFEAGVQLMQANKAPLLIFTGAKLPWEKRDTTEGAELRLEAIKRGVAPAKVIVTDFVANTADEARVVAVMMKERGWKRVILITTGWHMRRSAYQFTRAGVNFTPFPVDFRADPQRAWAAIDFLPKGDALALTETALRECYGYAFYRLFR